MIFSVITPTYNRARLLPRTIKAVLDQTCGDFEFIIVDDGSTDDTEEVVRSFRDPRIVYKKMPENKGVNAARNAGLDLASGRYINFLDSDDVLLPDALETFLKLWREVADEKIGNVVTMCLDGDSEEKIGYLEQPSLILEYKDIICREKAKGEFRSSWRKDAIGALRFEEGIFAQESILWWRLAKQWKYLYRDTATTRYYKGSELSLCSIDTQVKNASKMARGAEILLREHGDAWKQFAPHRYRMYLHSAAIFNILAGNRAAARDWIFKAFKMKKASVKNIGLWLVSFVPAGSIVKLIKLRRALKGKEVNY